MAEISGNRKSFLNVQRDSDKPLVTFMWIDPCPNERLRQAQERLHESVTSIGLIPNLFLAGPELIKFRQILHFARENCSGGSFVWCNSDVELNRNPFEVDDGENIHGFHRTEVPSGEICGGVDMYLIPCKAWDTWLSRAMPDLWCGATHIDWWLTRAAVLERKYRSHIGFIDHPSHETSPASKLRSNKYYCHNIREYNKWARRMEANRIERRISLPFIGESFSPITDYCKRILQKQ